MAILYEVKDVQFPKIKRRNTTHWIKKVIEFSNKKTGDINIIFCTEEEILRINKLYLNHDYYTDIITFDYTENDRISGDLFISLNTVKSNSIKFLTNYKEELLRVIIHGILHLVGFNDNTTLSRIKMKKKEKEYLKLFIEYFQKY